MILTPLATDGRGSPLAGDALALTNPDPGPKGIAREQAPAGGDGFDARSRPPILPYLTQRRDGTMPDSDKLDQPFDC